MVVDDPSALLAIEFAKLAGIRGRSQVRKSEREGLKS